MLLEDPKKSKRAMEAMMQMVARPKPCPAEVNILTGEQ
jgi:hypothetical protein